MRDSISNTAEYGDMTRGPKVITDDTREAMRKILADIQSGEFAREWIAENRAGGENFDRMRTEAQGQPDRAGRRRAPVDDGLDRRLTPKPQPGGKKQAVGRTAGMAALTLGALGVVFGDIGTSPLYALQTVFHADHGAVKPTAGRRLRRHLAGLLGDHDHRLDQVRDAHHARRQRRRGRDHGADRADPASVELAGRVRARSRWSRSASSAPSLFYGDGMITPAISVLSAVEGLEVVVAGARLARRADRARDPDRAVRRSSASAPAPSAGCSGR